MVQHEIKEQRSRSFRLMMSGIYSLVFLCVMFLSSVTASAATYYVQPDNTTNIGIDGTCNVASGQVTTAPTVRTTFDAVGNGATGSSYRPTTGMSNGTWTVMMKVYGPVYSGNAIDISAVTAANFSIRGYNATDQWTFHLYDYDPAGAAGNKTLVATSQTITSGTGGTVAVNPTYTINGTGRVQQNHRLLLEIAYRPGGTTYTPRIYYDTTGATTESYVAVTETPVASGDTLTASGNTAIAAVNPTDGTTGVLMQRFQVASNNAQNGQIELTSLNLTDNGNATSIQDAKVYISTTSSTTLPVGAVLIGNTGVWNGAATVVTLNGGTAADRTVSTGTPKFIYIVYDLAAGQTGNTIQSSVTGVGVAAPDTGAGNVGTSNLLTIQPCSDPTSSTITISASQTAYGDPYDVSGMYSTTGNVGSFQYKVTTVGTGPSTVSALNAWTATPQLTGTTGNLSGTFSISAGTNRLLVVAVDSQDTGGATGQTFSATYGGRALTQAVIENSNRRQTWIGYLREADIAARTGDTLAVTITGTHTNVSAFIASYTGVDQTTPIGGSGGIYGNNSAASYQFPAAITVSAGGYGIYTWSSNQTHSSDTETYTEHSDYLNGLQMGVSSKAFASAGTTQPNVTYAATARVSQSIIVLQPAASTVTTCTDWTSSSLIPASTAGGSLCGNYTNGNSYTLDVRGTDPDCGTSITTTAANFTWNSDGTAPSITAFTATSPSTSLNIPIATFTASDNISVTGYKITASATPPLAGDAGWTATAPSTFTVASDGTYALYPWAKDAAGNVSAVFATPRTVVVDTTAPAVSSTIPTNGANGVALNSGVTINWSENVNCTTVNTTNITSTSPGWTLSTCSANQAVFTTSGQAYSTTYSVTVTTAVTDTNGNPMAANYSFSYTTISAPDLTAPSSSVTTPANGEVINSASANPFTISGSATDNVAVSGIEVSTNGGTTWAAATCTGCPGANVTWTYSWTLPADGSYNIRSRATDSSINVETPGAGNTVTIDRTAPSVSSTIPSNGATGVVANSSVTITWSENVNCATVTTINITSTSPGWTLSTCSANQAVFTTSGQGSAATYSVTVTTGVRDANNNPMAANYSFSYTTVDTTAPSSTITSPTNGVTLNSASANPYTISGSAADNVAVQGIEVSTNGGTSWATAICTGCPGANVTWTYSWTLPADGSYNIRSRATDTLNIVETPGAGNTVTIDTTAPSASSTIPANGATGVVANSSVTINWSENVNCATINATNVTSTSPGWTFSSCASNQAVFTTSGQASVTTYSVTVSIAVTDANGNAMAAPYAFSYTTADAGAPSSAITSPANGAILNSASPTPVTISGSATDNAAVTGIEVSTNGGTTWNAATCTGCPGANVTWTYSWTLPADGSYTIRSRATDSSSNVETPGTGNTVSIDRTAPSVSSTLPANGATGVALNSSVTITWSENVDCATVNSTNITISGGGFALSTCSTNQAVFTTSGQAGLTTYTVTASSSVTDANGNPMSAPYPFSYTTADVTSPSVTAFTATTPSTSLNIPVTSFTASDNAGVTGYKITTSATPPLAGDAGWTAIAPSTFTVASDGTYALYPWAKDAAGNVSAVFATPGTVVVDTTAPAVSSTIPANSATGVALNSSVTITWSENVNCATVNTLNITSTSPGWTLSTCSGNQAVFTTSGQANITLYSATVTTGVTDANGNAMSLNYSFSYTTADASAPSSAITSPANGAILNSASSNPFTISGSATDNAAVTGIEVSTNGGTTWNAATCTGCPGANVTWTYSWTLPADGSYTIKSRATDSSSNVETPGTGNTVSIDRTAPAVSSTLPANGATGVALNSSVTITWPENVDCATVNTINITSTSPGWTLSTCLNNQAVFTTSGQINATAYSVTVTTAVRDANSNPMASNYSFSYTTVDTAAPSSTVTVPANGAALNSAAANPFTVSGSATDNVAVSGIEVSTNGGTTWNAATCTGCPGANVTWTYSWTLPADGSYTIRSRATDSSINVETPGAGNTVSIDRTAPTVSSTIPANGATGVAANSSVTITWSENVNCTTVTTLNITSTSPGWTLSTCSANQAVFTTSGQGSATTYNVTVTTGVNDANNNPMAANYSFSYTTTDTTSPSVTAFTATTPSTSLNIPVASFTANDNAGVTGYKITTSATPPLSGDAGWTGTAPSTFTVASDGTYTLYPWAKDASGNVSAVFATPVTVAVDTTAPAVSSTIPANGATGITLNSNVTITWSENIDCATVNTINITSTSPGWTLSTCSTNQAVFTTSGQASITTYSVTATTGVKDTAGNAMALNYSFSFTTADAGAPSSVITNPANGAILNSASSDPYTISGSATDNAAVTGIEVSTNGGTTWNAATCTGCPGANVTWTYSWTLPADGSYTIRSRATDSSSNIETPGAGNAVTVDRTAPAVSSTVPVNGATGAALNSNVTITWAENVSCSTVNTVNITSTSPGWTLSTCSGNQAVFTTSGQSGSTAYSVTITTAVTDANSNPMPVNYSFSYTTADTSKPTSTITSPANGAILNSASANPFTISGSATDNTAVSGIEVSTNGGATWNAATCAGCPGANVTWTYSWTLPADGSYNLKSRATDSSNNVETLGAGNTVTIDRTAPAVSSTIPANGATGVAVNSNVTITWSENVNCATVNTLNITSTSPGWTLSTCAGNQAVFTTSTQAGLTAYSVTVTTGVTDANGNTMTAIYSFSYTTGDVGIPASTITAPVNGATINSASANPYTINGSATDNIAVSGIEVSTNGGATWNAATCTGCPGANVTWSYSWTLPADGSYTIRSRATDSSSNVETPAAGNTVTIDRTAPTVSSTVPVNGATNISLNSSVTINWSENVNCATVNTTNVTISGGGWTLSTCSGNQAVFTTSAQASSTTYTVTATTGVSDSAGNPMSANYLFSYTTSDVTSPAVTSFTATSPTTSLNIPVTAFTASDNVSVTGFKITTSATPPLAGDAGWTAIAPSTFTVASDGTYTLYPWAKDAAGNVSAVFATPRTVIVDTTAPSVSSTIPANGASSISLDSNVTINWNENVDCATVTTANVTISPAVGWVRTSCSGSQAVFTPSGQAGLTAYSVTVTTGVRDAAGNAMSVNYSFSYTTGDVGIPASTITSPANGATINSASANPYTISGSATDNIAVSGIEVSTNGGTTWNAATCTGCPGANVTWTYSWTLPADGSYTIRSRATDSSSNVETPAAGNTLTIDRTAPTVSSTAPVNGTTNITLNSNVTVNWSENVDCVTVSTSTVTISPAVGWTRTSCSANQAVFSPSGQASVTTYTVTISTGVADANGNPMAANYLFSYTTADAAVPTVTAFSATSPSTSLNIPITLFTASDNVGVTGFKITTSATPPLAGDAGWTAIAPSTFAVASDGTYTLYPWAKDAAGNVSVVFATPRTVVVDTTAPSVTSTVPANGATGVAVNSNVTITWSENINCATVNTINITSTSPGWTLSTCSNNQAVFTTSGQTGSTAYSVTVTTAVRDTAGNALSVNYSFSYTTGDVGIPASSITTPANGAVINSAAANPFTISGAATDNIAVSSIEVSTNGGTTWNAATCTGCPGANVTWTYSWTLPADGSYTLKSRALDTSSNVETPGAGNTITIDRTAPSVSSTIPANSATSVALNSAVTITWNENVNCATVNTTNVTISGGGWTLSTCANNQAVFTTNGQAGLTIYSVTVTTGVMDVNNNPMTANYSFSYTTADAAVPTVTAFTATSPSTSLNIPVSLFTASDNVGVTGFKITTSATPPLAGDTGWTSIAPSTFTVGSDGTYTLYPWAKDAAGNVSAVFATPRTVVVDTTAPSVISTVPANGLTGVALNNTVTVNWNEPVDCATVTTATVTISPAVGWTRTSCSGAQAVFTPSGQASVTSYTVTVSTGIRDANGNAMTANYLFSYTTADAGIPASSITSPANGSTLNSASANPYTISGAATDNVSVTGIEVSTNGGTTWNAATCTGCPGANVTWTYAWTLPADGSYTIRSRATDSSSNVETPGAGNTVSIDRTSPAVSSTIPVNGAASINLNNPVTINWGETIDCATVTNTTVTISPAVGWTRSSCSGSQAIFTPSGQASVTTYTVTISTGVADANGNPMAANYLFSYTTADAAVPTVTAFSATSPSTSLNIPITLFTASDNVGVTGFKITTSATPPLAGDAGWTAIAPSTFAVASDGTYTLYPWAKDAAGNVSVVFATPRTVVVDTTAPSVTSTVPANGATGVALNSTVTVNWNEPVDCATVTTTSVTISPVVGWTRTSCSGGQAVFTPSGQASITSYTVTVNTGIRDANGNAMAANYLFSYTTADVIAPSSTITAPSNGTIINSASPNPYAISGAATDNVSVTGIEVSTNGGTTWNAATCTGCPGTNVTWTYSWTLPADGSYNIRSRAKDASNNTETPAPGNTVTVDRTAPSVSSTNPANGATGVALNSNVTVIWSENVNCSTVNTTNITINAGGWILSTCSNNQAIFTTNGQAGMTAYSVTVTTGVTDANGNPMSAIYSFSYTTADVTPAASAITSPANGAIINSTSPNPYTISGSASDNVAVQGIEVSTNGGATWNPATCTGCPGANVTWTYSWTLPADGSYNIRSRARDASNNTETPGAGNSVTIDRTAPSVNSTVPVNGAIDVIINSNVTITWSENVNCATVNTINITSTSSGWALLTCGANQAIFTASSQAYSTTYSVTVTTGVTDTTGNSITANYLFSYTTEAMPNNPPSNPTGLTQYKTDEVTTIGQGKWSNETTVVMKAAVSDPNGDTVQFEVEIQPSASAFTGTPNCTSGPAVASGGTAQATCGGLLNSAQYKWQARTIDAYGLTSGWVQFGTSDPDFGVDTVAPTYIWNTPAAGTYYKNGSPINVDVTVTEAGGSGILNGTDCTAAIDGSAASFSGIVMYSPITGKCTGTLTVNNPSGLINGAHNLTVQVPDTAGNSVQSAARLINIDNTLPSSAVITPANGTMLNTGSPNPYTVNGTASDNAVVSGIEVSTNGGTTWVAAACTGCPGANVTWAYSWTLPADGSYNIKSRAKDSANNTETPGTGVTVTVDRTVPSVSTTSPSNGASGTALNGSVTISWTENVNCTTVSASSITISSGGWALSSCSGTQAVFTTSGQANLTSYTITVSTAVKDPAGNSMAANYVFSFSTAAMSLPTLTYPAAPYDNGVDPDTGNTRNTFTFAIVYTDLENDAPAAGYPKIYIGDNDGYFSYAMIEGNPADTNYTDGKIYSFTTGLGAAQDLRFYFKVQAATGDTTAVQLPSGVSAYNVGPAVYLLSGYNLAGVPKNIASGSWTYTSVLGDDSGYQLCYKWDSTGLDTVSGTQGSWINNTSGMVQTGASYYIWSTDTLRRVDEPAGVVNDPRAYIDIALDANGGWTAITNPYNAIIKLQDVKVVRGAMEYTYTQAVINGWVSNSIYEWEGDGPGWSFKAFNDNPPATLEPWMGYFIYVYDTNSTKLRIYAPAP